MEDRKKMSFFDILETSSNETTSHLGLKMIDNTSSLRNDLSLSKFNQINKDNFHNKYDNSFLRVIREENIEYGYTNSLDTLISQLLTIDPIITAQWLNDLYIKHFSDSKVIFGILVSISRIKDESIRPSLIIMAISGLKHKDIEVREAAIRAFENWSDLASLTALKNLNQESEKWLKEYINQVISDLEANLCQRI
jgi:hypothetical protein